MTRERDSPPFAFPARLMGPRVGRRVTQYRRHVCGLVLSVSAYPYVRIFLLPAAARPARCASGAPTRVRGTVPRPPNLCGGAYVYGMRGVRTRGSSDDGAPDVADPNRVVHSTKLENGTCQGTHGQWIASYDGSLERIGITQQTYDTLLEKSNVVTATQGCMLGFCASLVGGLSLLVPGFFIAMAFAGEDVVTFLLIAVASAAVLCGVLQLLSKMVDKEEKRVAAAYEVGFVECQETAHGSGAVDVTIERTVKVYSGDVASEHFIVISGTPGI